MVVAIAGDFDPRSRASPGLGPQSVRSGLFCPLVDGYTALPWSYLPNGTKPMTVTRFVVTFNT